MDRGKKNKVNSELRGMCKISATGLDLDAEYNYKPIPVAYAAWQKLPKPEDPKKKKKGTDKAKKLEEFMLLVDINPPTYSLDFLRQHDAFRGSSADSKFQLSRGTRS